VPTTVGGGAGPATIAPAPSPIPSAPPRRPRRRSRRGSLAWAAFFLAPTTLGLGFFYIWPVVQTFYYSFTTWGPFGGHEWSGLDNYRQIFQDDEVLDALRNTVYFTVLGLAGIPISLVLAALLARRGRRGVTPYRTLLFLPVVTMPAAVAIVWRWLYNGDYGIVNSLLSHVGIGHVYWISDPDTALIAVALVGIWSSVGYNMVILMAGIQAIPRHYYEAAEMDGASGPRQFFSITVPLISPSLFFVTVLSVIGSLQTFDLVYVMIGRTNPALPQTRTVVYLFYQKAFIENDRGYAAALAFLLLLIIVAVTAFQFRLQKRWVHYE
jgi:multiple sugar transport system permease protein